MENGTICKYCAYWVLVIDGPKAKIGQCRAHPPTVHIMPVAVPQAQKIASGGEVTATMQPQQFFPLTVAEEFCGEHQPNSVVRH